MGMMDDIKDKASEAMGSNDNSEKIEQFAQEKGISVDEAKQHFMNKGDQSE